MDLKIFDFNKLLCNETNIIYIKATGLNGNFSIFNNHTSFISILKKGYVIFKKNKIILKKNKIEIKKSGILKVNNNLIIILLQ